MKAKAKTTSQPPTPTQTPNAKQTTLQTLRELKATLYKRAAIASQAYPEKADYIQKRVDADGAKIAFAINLVSVKL